jgi:NitT/TauT family transport system substrate-binding protein
MKRLNVASLIGIVAITLSCLQASAQDKIRVGLSSVSALHGALWVAEQKGIFKKYGIDIEVIVVGGAGTTGVSALLSGDIQYVSAAGDAIVNSSLRGGETVMIASVINKGFQRLVVRPDIKSAVDIKGKRVAVTRVGAISHTVLLMILRRWGMTEKDVQVVQLNSSPYMVAALEKGGVEGAVLTSPSIFVAEDLGYRTLVDLADTDIYYLQTMVATTRSYIRANREKTLRFLRAFVEGIAYFKQNKRESLDVLSKKLRVSAAQERSLERSYDLMATKFYEIPPYPSLRGVETVLGFVEKDNPKAKGADPKSFVDDSLLREIEASGFIKGLAQR